MAQRLKPTWEVYLRIGEKYGQGMETEHSFDEMAALFGVPRQRIYHETYVALGKLIYGLNRDLKLNIDLMAGLELRAKGLKKNE